MTQEDLLQIMKEHPTLRALGFGVEDDVFKLENYLNACNAACEWLSLVQRTKSINRRVRTSYQLKHAAQRWYEAKYERPCYIPDGAFIAAAIHMGFEMLRKRGDPSVYLNISAKSKIDGKYI